MSRTFVGLWAEDAGLLRFATPGGCTCGRRRSLHRSDVVVSARRRRARCGNGPARHGFRPDDPL